MCVISHSPAGVDLPKEEDMKAMFTRNPHGAGFAITRPDGFTEWHKGYMTYEDFRTKLGEFDTKLLKDNPVTLHFRITTKGNTDQQTTHPFPVTPRFADMRKLHGITSGPLAFHNGTIIGFGGIGASVSSDTQDFVMGPLYYILRGVDIKKPIGALRQTAIKQLLGASRLLIMMPNQRVERFGASWTEHTDKCFYSNMLWRTSTTARTTTTHSYGTKTVPPTTSYLPAATTTASSTATTTGTELKYLNSQQPDKWGKHSYVGVWPAKDREWLEFSTSNIRKLAMDYMEEVEVKGEKGYKDKKSGNIYYTSGERELLTDKGFDRLFDVYSSEDVVQRSHHEVLGV